MFVFTRIACVPVLSLSLTLFLCLFLKLLVPGPLYALTINIVHRGHDIEPGWAMMRVAKICAIR